MEGGEGGGGSSRDGAFCFGVENSVMSFLSRGGSSNSQEQRGFGLNQAPRGLNQLVIPGHFPQSGSPFSSTFPMRTDFFGSEPYDNISIPNSTPNLFASSSSNSFASQMASFPSSMTNNFYSASALPCNSMALPTASQHALLPANSLSVNFFYNECPDVEKTKNQEGCIYGEKGSKSIQPRENDALRMLQISRQLINQTPMEEFDDDLNDTDLKLILRKELSNSDVGTVGRIVLPKKEAESNLPTLTEREGIILNMDDLELPVTWKFKYRFWPNNRSRMYIMETTGDFVKAHGLQAGDYFIIYRSLTSENYVVRGKKGTQPPTHFEALH